MPITFDEVRRRILIALVSDDELLETLVLKGGNALVLVHDISQRATLDMDFSMATQFANLADVRTRIFDLLRREFGSVGYVLFDEKFVPKPNEPSVEQPDWWGGYFIEFKLVEQGIYEQYRDDKEVLRRRAAVLGPEQRRKYTIDISKYEYCASKVRKEIDNYSVYVYSLEMIAIEKLRAICQQMPMYTLGVRRPRSRDFYDIHEIVRQKGVDLTAPESRELLAHIFAAKHVPVEWLGEISQYRSFHEPDWPAVEASISGGHEQFEYYFRFVVDLASTLQSLRKE